MAYNQPQATLTTTSSSCTLSLAKSMHVSISAPWSNEICTCIHIWVTGPRVNFIAWGWIGETTGEQIYADISAIPEMQYSAWGGRRGQPGLANEKIEKWGVRRWILRQAWDVGVKKGEKKHEALPPSLNGVHHFTSLRRADHEKNHKDFLNICVN